MNLKLEKLQFEQRSVENDLRAQISEQQREIKRLKSVDEEKEKKLEKRQRTTFHNMQRPYSVTISKCHFQI